MSTIDRRGAAEPYYPDVAEAAYVENGWLTFAALMIVFTGIWNIIEGFVAFLRSAYFVGSPVFGALWVWSLIWIGLGILLVAIGSGIMTGRSWARWFGIAIVGIATIVHMLALGAYPWWSVFIIGIDVVILYALTVRWPRSAPATPAA